MIKEYLQLKFIIISIIIFISLVLIIKYYNNMYFTPIDNENIDDNLDYEYIIIGSGPAGLQAGYFLEKYKKKYVILEKSSNVGDFFKKYPIHRKLISINKVYTGTDNKEFNLRHDWNSLLSDDDSLLFKNYSKEFYPKADTMVEYLNDFYKKNKLNILFNFEVRKIDKVNENEFSIIGNNVEIKSSKLIVAVTAVASAAP